MGTDANVLIISNDRSVINTLSFVLSGKKLKIKCSACLRNSSTIKKYQMSDLIIMDLVNPSKNLPVLLSLFENADHQPVIVVITIAEIFRIIWKHLERYNYFLIIKPCDTSLTRDILADALEKMNQWEAIKADYREANIRKLGIEAVSNLELGPRQLLYASSMMD